MATVRVIFVAGVLAIGSGIPAPAAAQLHSGRIIGTVVDDRGEPVEGAAIDARNPQATPPRRESESDEKGRFGLLGLRSGTWTLMVTAAGHEPAVVAVGVVGQRPGPPLTLTLVKIPNGQPSAFDEVSASQVLAELEKAERLRREGKIDAAIAAYEALRRRAPALTSLQLAVGRLYREKQDFARAQASLEALLAKEPANHRARLELGDVWRDAGQSVAAAASYEQVSRDAAGTPLAAAARQRLAALRP